jgi:hypothetical protein
MKGVMVNRMRDDHRPAHHVAEQADGKASVRESSLMMLNGSMMNVGCT